MNSSTQYLSVSYNSKHGGELSRANGTRETNSLVPIEAGGFIQEIFLRELPVFNRAFHEPRHHDEAQDQDVNTGEDFVDHG